MTARRATPSGSNQRLSQRTLETRAKQAEAARMYLDGHTAEAIRVHFKWRHRSSVTRAIQAVYDRQESVTAETLREVHGARIAQGYLVVADVLRQAEETGEAELRLKALDRLGRLMEREAKLHGLDAPTRQEFTGELPLTVVFDQALQPKRMELE